jgi:hypothetical protein
VITNRVLTTIFGFYKKCLVRSKGKSFSKRLRKLFFLPNIIRFIKSKGKRGRGVW